MKTKDAIAKLRETLTGIIVDTLRKYDAFNTTGDERLKTLGEVYLYDEDFTGAMPAIEIDVDNSYLDVEETCTEERVITQFIIDEDGEFYVILAGPDAPEFDPEVMTIDELASIADFLEVQYEELKKERVEA